MGETGFLEQTNYLEAPKLPPGEDEFPEDSSREEPTQEETDGFSQNLRLSRMLKNRSCSGGHSMQDSVLGIGTSVSVRCQICSFEKLGEML